MNLYKTVSEISSFYKEIKDIMLDNLELSVAEDFATIEYTNTKEHFCSYKFPTKITQGNYLLNYKKMFNFLKIEPDAELLQVDSKIYLKAKNRKINVLLNSNVTSFPEIPDIGATLTPVIVKKDLSKLLKSLMITTTSKNVNKVYSGILFKETYLSSTDIHRLTFAENAINTKVSFVITTNVAKFIIKTSLKSFSVTEEGSYSVIKTEQGVLVAKNIENSFPDVSSVVGDEEQRKNMQTAFKIDSKYLKKEVSVIEKLHEKTKVIATLLSQDFIACPKLEYSASLKTEIMNKTDKKVGINAKYLKQVSDILGEGIVSVTIVEEKGLNPVLFYKEEVFYMVMPLRV